MPETLVVCGATVTIPGDTGGTVVLSCQREPHGDDEHGHVWELSDGETVVRVVWGDAEG